MNQRWLKILGGKPEYAGLGIFTIGLLIGFLGLSLGLLAPEPRGESFMYIVAYSIVVVGVLIGVVGMAYHLLLVAKRGFGGNNDA